MKDSKKKILFYISVIGLLFVSVTIGFMPFASQQKENDFMIPVYITGGFFWLFTMIGYGSFLILNHKRKINYKTCGDNANLNKRLGIFCVWSNLPAKIFDILTGVSVVVLIIALLKDTTATQRIFSILAVFFFSLNMHGLFNGANYNYIKFNVRGAKGNEQ